MKVFGTFEAKTRLRALLDERRVTTGDASYLELAMRLGTPLATKDSALARAAAPLRIKTLAA